jgi:hypothetical protein
MKIIQRDIKIYKHTNDDGYVYTIGSLEHSYIIGSGHSATLGYKTTSRPNNKLLANEPVGVLIKGNDSVLLTTYNILIIPYNHLIIDLNKRTISQIIRVKDFKNYVNNLTLSDRTSITLKNS